jgi:imidazole glycerol-phosphate synthase subunit HisH
MSSPLVTIIDYGVGNIASIAKMMQKAGARVELTDRPEAVLAAERLLLPGVGAFDACAKALQARQGLPEAIKERVIANGVPLLGICVGMQLLASGSEEGTCGGLGFIAGRARRFDFSELPANGALRVPHMSWSVIEPAPGSRLFPDSTHPRRFYFVHSYHVVPEDSGKVAAWASYGVRFTAAVESDNIFGVQFHPEKSHSFGLDLFRRFIEL